jgi:type IV pilus assembly protein PilC
MAAFRDKFSYAEINVVRAAERIGQPQRAIKQLCDFSKTLSSTRRKITLAMVYPCIVLTMAVCVLSILGAVVIPQFSMLFFSQMHCELPRLTRVVMAACTLFRKHAVFLIILPFVALCCLKLLPKSRKSEIFQKLPIISSLVREYDLYLFTSTLSMLLACNVQLQEGLGIAQNVVSDKSLLGKLSHGVERIKHGEPLSSALGGILSSFSIGLIVAGEHTGSRGASLAEVADLHGNNLAARLAAIAAIIEPVLIVALALIVGTVIIAVFLPMVNVMQGMGAYAL